jgi:hypothetical protein
MGVASILAGAQDAVMWADRPVRAPDGGKLTCFPPLVRQAAPAFLTSPDEAADAARRGRLGEEICCLSREGERHLEVGRPNLSMVFFLFVAVTRAILTYPNKVLRKIQYFYVVLVYGASTPALIYPLASLS